VLSEDVPAICVRSAQAAATRTARRYKVSAYGASNRARAALQKWMNQTSNVTWAMTEQNRQISAIRRHVPDPRDAEDILQDAFYKLVEANRLLMPIDRVTTWLFRVARNRITDLFRKKKPETFSHASVADEDGELLQIEDLVPSPDAGPEALYVHNAVLDVLEETERQQILNALKECDWVVAGPKGAAAHLGMKRSTLQQRIHKLGIARHSA
jgi:RNA polymerase sigma factor (sigma-70 family)